MSRQILLRSPPVNRKQPLLTDNDKTTSKTQGKKNKGFGEVAGGTTAECAAICCCCPCSVMNLLILAVYKVPTELCKKAWKRKKRQRTMKKRKAMLGGSKGGGPTREELEKEVDEVLMDKNGDGGATEAVDLEKEMWDRFYGTGFWRSPSQRVL